MPILGCHMSVAGGFHKAVIAAARVGCDCVQIFTKNNSQWKAKPITAEEARLFQECMLEHRLRGVLSHASYLINMASPREELREKSVAAMVIELQRAEQLGIAHVVVHPGSFTSADEATGIDLICRSIDQIHQQLPACGSQILLENTAGQGSNLGWQFQQLEQMIEGTQEPSRLGVCIDTCHAFAAGYALSDPDDYRLTIQQLQKHVGLHRIKAFHLNDSKHPRSSRKDRHEHIGRGEMGLESFRNLLNDSRFAETPMYLETAKGLENGQDLDAINLNTLRGLVAL